MAKLYPENILFLVVHSMATRGYRDKKLADVDYWHRKKGWDGCGYHYVIDRDGTIEVGRPESKMGAHVKGYNSMSLGICLSGGLDARGVIQEGFDVAYTPEQGIALDQLLSGLQWKYPDAEVTGHRELSPDANGDGVIQRAEWLKNCPCFDVKSWVENSSTLLKEVILNLGRGVPSNVVFD